MPRPKQPATKADKTAAPKPKRNPSKEITGGTHTSLTQPGPEIFHGFRLDKQARTNRAHNEKAMLSEMKKKKR